MKISFYQENKEKWSDRQAEVSEKLCRFLESKKNFFVQFGEDKTPAQHKGYWRLCGLLAPSFQEEHGECFDKDLVSDLVKDTCNYVVVVRGRRLVKSLRNATLQDMQIFIEKLYQICAHFGLENYELTSEENRALIEYYK